jgi:hypothetical protein
MFLLRLSLVVILITSMVKFSCPGKGCGRQFTPRAALSAHKRHCKLKIAAAAKILLGKRRDKEILGGPGVPIPENQEEVDDVDFGLGGSGTSNGAGPVLEPQVSHRTFLVVLSSHLYIWKTSGSQRYPKSTDCLDSRDVIDACLDAFGMNYYRCHLFRLLFPTLL